MEFWTNKARRIRLGKLLGRGGEASVYNVVGRSDIVAKIYSSAPSAEKEKKLAWMTGVSDPGVAKFAAWPSETLHESPGGSTKGILMPRINEASEIHELYSPAHRRREFPSADWRFLVRVARNCAAAFAKLHAKGVVIGDVNQGNIFVTRQAIVKLIDCDSFQVKSHEDVFKCTVGVAHFQPPELQSVRFDQITRTTNHDNFGLAVLVFHLLFMGRHPFSVRPLDREDISIEDAIKTNRFPYGRQALSKRVAPPPNSLRLSSVSTRLAEYFESAFAPAGSTGERRPTANQWAEELHSFEARLIKCSDDPGHLYFGAVNSCPWCRFEANGGPAFFVSVTVPKFAASSEGFDIDRAWKAIASVQAPRKRYRTAASVSVANIQPTPVPAAYRKDIKLQVLLKKIAIVGCCLNLFGLFFLPLFAVTVPTTLIFGAAYFVISGGSDYGRFKKERGDAVAATKDRVEGLERRQREVAIKGQESFNRKLAELNRAHDAFRSLAGRKGEAVRDLQRHARERQLVQHLEQCYISTAAIPGIGAGRVATLQSYGIETAKDVMSHRLDSVPGFGPALSSRMETWARMMEASFRFDASKGVPQSDLQALEHRYSVEEGRIVKMLRHGARELERIAEQASYEVNRMDVELARERYELVKAEKDYSVCF